MIGMYPSKCDFAVFVSQWER